MPVFGSQADPLPAPELEPAALLELEPVAPEVLPPAVLLAPWVAPAPPALALLPAP
jgi:hypothetical protein